MLGIVLLVLPVLVHQAILLYRYRRIDPFAPETLLDAGVLLVVVYAIYSHAEMTTAFARDRLALAVVFSGILALYVGLHWPFRTSPSPAETEFQVSRMDARWLWVGFAAYCAVNLHMLRYKMQLAGADFWTYFVGERLTATLEDIILGARLPYDALMALTLGPTLLLLALQLERRRFVGVLIFLTMLLGMLALFVTRFTIVLFLSYPVVWYHLRVKRLGWGAGLALLVGFVLVLQVLDIWRASGLLLMGEREALSMVDALARFGRDANAMQAFYWLLHEYQRGTLGLEYGLNYIYGVVTFVPRMLWPSKPLTAFDPRWTEHITGEPVGSGVPIYTFTAFGEGLAQFGIIGVPLNLFLYGLMVGFVRSRMRGHPIVYLAYFHFSMLSATYLRSGTQALFVLFVMFALPTLFLYRHLLRTGMAESTDSPTGREMAVTAVHVQRT
jgi:hypothetical protein